MLASIGAKTRTLIVCIIKKSDATDPSFSRFSMEVLFGRAPVLAALRSGRRALDALLVSRPGPAASAAAELAAQVGVPVSHVARDTLDRLTDGALHQGLGLRCGPYRVQKIKAPPPLEQQQQQQQQLQEQHFPPLWVALDSIHDPMNIGAIIRSSCFFGAQAVLLCDSHTGPLSPLTSKASAGAMEAMSIYATPSLPQFLLHAALAGWQVVGTGGAVVEAEAEADTEADPEAEPLHGSVRRGGATRQARQHAPGSARRLFGTRAPATEPTLVDASSITLHKPTILVVGNEGKGVRLAVQRACHKLCLIPSSATHRDAQHRRTIAELDCLNVSVAAGILLAHLTHSRPRASAL
jgi:21S rRNA (GM2251-2'-O)-methyltransferase